MGTNAQLHDMPSPTSPPRSRIVFHKLPLPCMLSPSPLHYHRVVPTAQRETEESHTASVKVLTLPVSRVNNAQHIWLSHGYM